MDDWYEEDEQSDGLASAEAKSLRSKFYNLGTALLECARRPISSHFVHGTVKARWCPVIQFSLPFSSGSCRLQFFYLGCLLPVPSVPLFVTRNLRDRQSLRSQALCRRAKRSSNPSSARFKRIGMPHIETALSICSASPQSLTAFARI